MEKQQKLAVLISCFNHHSNRMCVMEAYLQSRGYSTLYLTSDYDHMQKEFFVCQVPGAVQLPVRSYRRNLSVDRILSHRDFAKEVYRYLESLPQEPAMVVAILPPNFLGAYLKKYKTRHKNVKLIFDLFDLWPETFPSGKAKKLLAPAFWVWGALRDRALPAADRILAECDLFRQKLGLQQDPRCHTMYLAGKRAEGLDLSPCLPKDSLSLCYLGSINNIIDISAISQLVGELAQKRPVQVHVIGKGERREEFLAALESAGAAVFDHGVIYDPVQQQQIISRCHFGLNIMKPTVCVGLTMKSVDYWSHDLPIINSIPADTQRLVTQEGVGIALQADTARRILALSEQELLQMRENVHKMYDRYFDSGVILRDLDEFLKEIV